VISMVPAATAASTGIKFVSPNLARYVLLLLLPYIKCKSYKTSSNSRRCGKVENSFNYPVSTDFALHP